MRPSIFAKRHLARLFLIGGLVGLLTLFGGRLSQGQARTSGPEAAFFEADYQIFLPFLRKPAKVPLRANAPFFIDSIRFEETAIFWFGTVTPSTNYTDVRVGYTPEELYVHLATFDRSLWYDPSPLPSDLTNWDAATLLLAMNGDQGDTPDAQTYRFVSQLNWSNQGGDWQAAYRWDGASWTQEAVPFTADTGWRGNTINDEGQDRGWRVSFRIPFSSLGLPGAPDPHTVWGLTVTVHDRDSGSEPPLPVQRWPKGADPARPTTWGQLGFGIPDYSPPPANGSHTTVIRHGLDGVEVPDGTVGGHSVCGSGVGSWGEWGEANYDGYWQFNIQNQWDLADWPCFSKYLVTFPLDAIPANKVILDAKLRMNQFGNAGVGYEPPPQPSYIQVLRVLPSWEESTLTWNNTPSVRQNYPGAWVDPLDSLPDPKGVTREWDVTAAAADAYASGGSLRLALYSADSAYNSGKYFFSSDTADWNATGRPTLEIVWGDP